MNFLEQFIYDNLALIIFMTFYLGVMFGVYVIKSWCSKCEHLILNIISIVRWTL
jgi:hypothetical protein